MKGRSCGAYLCRRGRWCKKSIGLVKDDARVTLMTLQSSVTSASFGGAGRQSVSAANQTAQSEGTW